MMEGEAGTPVAVRLPDEETSFIARKVEAPRRRQRQQQLKARKKRLAVLTAATVTMLAFGAVGVFLTVPSDTSDEVKTAVSQAMASATTKSDEVFVPNFDVYDEDGDGKVSLGEYLDRMAINRDAALEKIEASSLDEEEKARISDALNEDFNEHSNCVSNIAQDHEDEMMTEENFKEIYQIITKEFCPMNDDDIPDSYQVTETAPGKEEEVPIEVHPDLANSNLWGSTSDSLSSESSQSSSDSLSAENSQSSSDSSSSENSQGSTSDSLSSEDSQSSTSDSSTSSSEGSQSSSDESSDEPTWNPEKPTFPPRPVHKTKPDGVGGKTAKMWTPIYPTDPPIPDTKGSGWNPDEPTDASSAASQDTDNTEADNSSSSISEDVDHTQTESSSSSSSGSEDIDTTKFGIGDGQWNPTYPTSPPEPENKEKVEPDEKASYGDDGEGEREPEAAGWESAIAVQENQPARPYSTYSAYTANVDTGAYNAYTGADTNTYGKSINTQSYPEAAAQESPFSEATREDEQPARPYSAYSAYTANADTGAYNAYTGANTNTYKSTDTQSNREGETKEFLTGKTQSEDGLRGEGGDFSRGRASEGTSYKSANSWKQLRRATP